MWFKGAGRAVSLSWNNFKHLVWQTVLTRRNTYTGIQYRDDPTIFAWELINEPRCITDASGDTLQVSHKLTIPLQLKYMYEGTYKISRIVFWASFNFIFFLTSWTPNTRHFGLKTVFKTIINWWTLTFGFCSKNHHY